MTRSDKFIYHGKNIILMSYSLDKTSAGKFSNICLNPLMRFHPQKYRIQELGNLFTMTMNMGIMQMMSFIITPFERDMPMISLDFIFLPGRSKAYAEFYDLTASPDSPHYIDVTRKMSEICGRYTHISDISQNAAPWYSDIRKIFMLKESSDKAVIDVLFQDVVSTYIEVSRTLPLLSPDEQLSKRLIVKDYCEKLARNGGASTNIFKEHFGEEYTLQFFTDVMFGCNRK